MKRTRLARGAVAPRVLRRKNVVHDEEDSEAEEEDARMSGEGAADEEDEEEEGDEEEGDEEEDDEEDDEDEDEEDDEEEEEEEEANQTQRRRTSDRIKSATPPPKKKLRRGAQAKREEEEEEEDDDDDASKQGSAAGDEEEEEEEGKSAGTGRKRMPRRAAAAAAAPPRRNERPAPKRGAARRNKVDEEEEEEEGDEQEEKNTGKESKTKVGAAESEDVQQEREEEDTGTMSSAAATPMDVDNDDTEETKSEGTPFVTPSSSPVRRTGLSINTLINSETPTPTKKRDRKPDEVPFQHLRDRLRGAASEPELLEVITSACSSLIKDGKAPNRLFAVALLSAVKENPSRYQQPALLKYLLRLLRSKHYVSSGKDSASGGSDPHGSSKKTSSSSSISSSIAADSTTEMPLPVVIANILLHILKDSETWPEDSFKVFLDDSLHSRVWVDHEFSSTFVRNIKTMIRSPEDTSRERSQAPALVRPRFIEGKDRVELRELAMKHIRLRLNELEKERSAMTKVIRPMVLALIDFVSIPEARVIAAENLDTWLQNPATKGPAKDLLNKVVSHCKTMEAADVRAVDILFKLKLKPTMFQVKVETITQLVRQHEGYMRLALNLFISRERPNNMGKDVDNMKLLQQIFRASRTSATSAATGEDTFYTVPVIHPGALASRELGFVFRDLCSSSEVAPVLKTMVRKIVKQLAFDNIDMKTLCVEILKNDDHLDALDKFADMRLLDYTALVTGTVWLVLLMRGAAVKSLQIQQTNASASGSRPETGAVQLGGPSKLGAAQAIPRRAIQSVVAGGVAQAVRVSKHGGAFGKNKAQVAISGKASPSSACGSSSSSAVASGGAPQDVTISNKAVKLAVKAKEELQQTLAHVQRQALISCHEIFHKFGLTGKSAFEKSLYESIVKKLLFLDIPPDVQPTEHDKTCFLSTKEDIPLHEDSLEMLTSLLSACESVDRVEALRTLEAIVFRAAEGHMNREELWGAAHSGDLVTYSANGGILGLEVTRTTFVIDLLRLTVWKGEHKLEHEFCHSSRFWICCSILLIVGSFNPTTVGDFLWREIPTLRAIMQMLITGRFEFPSVSSSKPDLELFGGHRENFSDLLHANTQLREYEQHVMVTVASNVEDPLMLFEIQGVARQPPPAIIDHLKVLDRKFRLGTRLRQSRTKDFLMEMVAAGAGVSESAGSDGSWWITDIVCEDFDTVQYLPYECLCRLLLLARRGSPSSAASAKGAKKARQLALVVPRLQFKLHEFLVDPSQIDQGAKVVLYFLDCLVSGAPRDRRVASQILVDLTRDEMEVESASSTPKSESDGTLDEAASSTLPAMEGLNPLDTMNTTMSFEWLGALLKLPCYNQVRDNVFSALESLLDRESTVGSLSSCIKALHAFWKDACEQHQQEDASSASKSSVKTRIPYSGAAADASVQLAGTFGRLLTTREFVCRHLLQQRDVCEIICEIFWSVVALQLRHDTSDRSGGIRFSDCKVFYATDGTSTVREIKLPLPVIHGAIRVLCATAYSPQDGSVAFEKLSDCLFPKVKKDSSTAILSSTGVIATKDRRLYPAHLLKTMVQHSSNPHLVASAAKATPAETLWELLRSTGLSDHALACVTRALAELIKSNESVAVTSLQAVTKMETAQEAAAEMEGSASIVSPNKQSTDRAREYARYLHDWIALKAESAQRKLSTVTEDEEALLSSGFTAFSVSPPKADKRTPLFTVSFDEDIEPEDSEMSLAAAPVEPIGSDWSTLSVKYPTAKIQPDPSRNGASSFASKAVNLVLGSCRQGGSRRDLRGDEERQSDPSSAWSRRIALLHCIRGSCHSSSGAARLGEVVTQVVEHVASCDSESCATECCEFVKQACAMVGDSYSESASYCFVEQATRISDVSISTESHKSTRSIYSCLSTLLFCVDTVTLRWAKNKYAPTLSPLWLHNIVALVIEVEILARSLPAGLRDSSNETKDNVGVLLRIVDSLGGGDAAGLVFILESLLSACASIVSGQEHHQDVRRELIEALYFSYPRAVSAHLDVLDPSWKWTTNPLSKGRLYLKHGAAEAVGSAVADLKRESADAVDRLRELSIREPVLVQNGLLSLLQEWKGDMSLTLLYQKSGDFQQIIRVADMIAPHFMNDNKAVEALLEFVFEILDTISRHQAAEFYQLVARMLAFLADALTRDQGCIAGALFTADRLESLRAVTGIYESVAEIASFAGVLEDAHNSSHVKDALVILEAARNKTVASSEDQRLVRAFLERLQASAVVTDAAAALEIETSLQLLLQILNKAQELGTRVPLLAHCAEAVAPLLEQPNMTKPAMKTLCQVLLALIKHDPTDAVSVVAPHYLRCLTSLRIALRECVLVYIADFLALTDGVQRRAILERLYDDFSDVAKSKLMAFVKSSAFKTSYEDHNQLS